MAGVVTNISQSFSRKEALIAERTTPYSRINLNATKTLSAMRILFGAIFLFDGVLQWVLFQQGTMQGVIDGYGNALLSNNRVAVGVLVGVGGTAAGLALIIGVCQRPAAVAGAGIMLTIWGFGGFAGFGMPAYTDPGGDLMLALVFVVLIFAPYAYGLASRYQLRDRWAGTSAKDRLLRFLVT